MITFCTRKMDLIGRIRLKLDAKLVQPIVSFFWRRKNKNNSFTIISNNCWGGGIYQELRVPYNTPTIGLYLYPDDYIKFLTYLKYYCTEAKLTFANQSKHKKNCQYPVGLLDNEIEIHFLHYKSENEAKEKWDRRKRRINWNNLFVKMDDRDGCTNEHCAKFESLPFSKKILFSACERPYTSNIYLPKCRGGEVEELYANKHLWRREFDIIGWLNE